MTDQNNSTYPKYDITKRVQGYLETAMPQSVLLAAYRTGRHEAIVAHVKEHYNADAGDCIGIETVVRDAVQNLVLNEAFQEANSSDLPLPPSPWRVCEFPHAGSDVPWSVKDADGVVIADFHTKGLAMLFAAAAPKARPHLFVGHADAPTTWCIVPDSRTENGYCGQSKDAAIHANGELAEDLRKAIFDVELMIELNQVTNGPRNSKERTEQAERHALVGRLTKIRRALYRSKDVIENLEA